MAVVLQNRSHLSRGFTLIEIVMVLVLLGILSAVAVPKYFDLQKTAETKALQQTVQTLQAELQARFAGHLLAGGTCSAFVSDENKNELETVFNTELQKNSTNSLSVIKTGTKEFLVVKGKNGTDPEVGRLSLPTCQ